MSRRLVLAIVLLWPSTLFAQSLGQPYLAVAVGANFADTMHAGNVVEVSTDTGSLGSAELGWGFSNGLRAGIEGRLGANSVATISRGQGTGQLLPLTNIGGDLLAPAAMARLSYQINPADRGFFDRWPVQPFVGAGLGYAWLHFVGAGGDQVVQINLPANNVFVGPGVISYGTGGAIAYEASTGLSLPLGIARGLDATIEYRFFGTARAEVVATARSTAADLINGMVPTGKRKDGFEAHDSALLVGLRYALGRP